MQLSQGTNGQSTDFRLPEAFELGSTVGIDSNTGPGVFSEPAQRIEIGQYPAAKRIRRLRILIDTSWGERPVGLSEVRFSGNESEPVPLFRWGDHDGSGIVDINDPLDTLYFLFLNTRLPICLDASDADNSATVDMSDAIGTLGFLFLGGFLNLNDIPPGSTFCGPDPTVEVDLGFLNIQVQPSITLGCDQYPADGGILCD
jgi:hypothetical protein